jgi:hypothetical protein
MSLRPLVLSALLTISTAAGAAPDARPLPTPPKYTTPNYAITFDVPRNTTYCPLPKGWIGSDHGTTIFLAPPKLCGGAGYPSSGRGFEPAQTPRIEVYYGYVDDFAPEPCLVAGHARLFGRQQALCRSERDGMEVLTAHGYYETDTAAEVYLSLAVPAKDEPQYMRAFLELVASVRTCRPAWSDDGKPISTSHIGDGSPCAGGWF